MRRIGLTEGALPTSQGRPFTQRVGRWLLNKVQSADRSPTRLNMFIGRKAELSLGREAPGLHFRLTCCHGVKASMLRE